NEDVDRHISQHFANETKLSQILTKCFTLFGVTDCIHQRGSRTAHAACPQLVAADVEDIECDDVSLANFTQNVLHRNLAVIQDQRTGRGPSDPQLLLLRTYREPGERSFYDERCELLAVDFREYDKNIGERGICDPHLFAIQEVMLAIRRKLRASACIESI